MSGWSGSWYVTNTLNSLSFQSCCFKWDFRILCWVVAWNFTLCLQVFFFSSQCLFVSANLTGGSQLTQPMKPHNLPVLKLLATIVAPEPTAKLAPSTSSHSPAAGNTQFKVSSKPMILQAGKAELCAAGLSITAGWFQTFNSLHTSCIQHLASSNWIFFQCCKQKSNCTAAASKQCNKGNFPSYPLLFLEGFSRYPSSFFYIFLS